MDILIIIIIAAVITGLAMAIDNYYRKKALRKQVEGFLQKLDETIKTQSGPLTDGQIEQVCLNIFVETLDESRIQKPPFAQMIHVVSHGEKVFGTNKNFQAWLDKPNYALGGVKPRTLITTPAGIDAVENQLILIKDGFWDGSEPESPQQSESKFNPPM